jgi:uncharacterized protein (DUF111 family)
VLLETNIDHLSAEALAFVCEELMNAGALDVWLEPIVMKKGRLASRLSALVSPSPTCQEITERFMALSGSLGVRRRYVERVVAPREIVVYQTRFGPVPFKVARFLDPENPGAVSQGFANLTALPACADPDYSAITWLRPEHEAVARIAREQGIDYAALVEELVREAARQAREDKSV